MRGVIYSAPGGFLGKEPLEGVRIFFKLVFWRYWDLSLLTDVSAISIFI